MARSKNAKIMMEQGQSLVDFVALTDSGDHTIFNPADLLLSGKDGFAPDIKPNGIVTGLNLVIAAVSGSNDVVDVKAFTANSKGTVHSVAAATDESITRPATDVAKVNSITMDDTGAIAVIAGTDGATAAFSESRGVAGGPPYIPVDSVEIGQVRLTTTAAAPITAAEIYQTIGQHAESASYPAYTMNNIGEGTLSDESAKVNAFLEFVEALPLAHTGDTPKKVWVKYYTPSLAMLQKTSDFVPAETANSVSTEEYYGGEVASVSSSLNQASFTSLLNDGVNDPEIAAKGEVITFKFYPNRTKAAFIVTQGTVSLSRTFAVADQIATTVTISPEVESSEFAS